jgi:hypothetical protein
VDPLQQLRKRAKRSYEVGRLRAASRIGIFIVPAAAACMALGGAAEASFCAAVLLAMLATTLRWRSAAAGYFAGVGFRAGLVPMALGLVALQLLPEASGRWQLALTACCFAGGAIAGVVGGLRAAEADAGLSTRASAAATLAVATLTAMVGCAGLGVGAVIGVTTGIVMGGVVAVGFRRGAGVV